MCYCQKLVSSWFQEFQSFYIVGNNMSLHHLQQLQSECCTFLLSGCAAAAGMSWQPGLQRPSRRKHENYWENTAGLFQRSSMHEWLGNLEHMVTKKNWGTRCFQRSASPLIFACRLGCRDAAAEWRKKTISGLGKIWGAYCPKPLFLGNCCPINVRESPHCFYMFWGVIAISMQLTICWHEICLEIFGCTL